MARCEIVRHTCNGCSAHIDVPIGGKRPTGWTSFLVNQKEPAEGNPIFIDLCQGDTLGFLDFVYGEKGPHREAQAQEEAP